MQHNPKDDSSDSMLARFLSAKSESISDELLRAIIDEHADPIIKKILRSKLRVSLNGRGTQLVLEDGEPQTIRSVRRIPASVLLLLDTGGFRNPAMKTNTTRDLSVRLVSQLRAGDQVAAFQFGGKVELIQTWTSDQSVAIHSLKTKLSSGRNGRFQNALAAASVQLTSAPPGNRHIVLVTDGAESLLDKDDLAAGMKQLYTALATVHVISYTLLGRKAISMLHPKIPVIPIAVRRKNQLDTAVAPIFPNADKKLAEELKHKSILRIILEGSYPASPNLDFPMWRHSRDQLKTLKQNDFCWVGSQRKQEETSFCRPRKMNCRSSPMTSPGKSIRSTSSPTGRSQESPSNPKQTSGA